jgi:Organic solvent tolerance protein OstA
MSSPRTVVIKPATSRRVALVPVLGRTAFWATLGACVSPCVLAADPHPTTAGTESACRLDTAPDPRIDQLLKADPNNQRIDVTSDTGDLGRAGDAVLSGHVAIRTGQRLLTADEAQINATDRSIQLHGNMEYLDPQLHVRGNNGAYTENGGGTFEGAQFELLDRSVRGAARDAELTPNGTMKLDGVEYTACPPGNEDWRLAAGRIEIDQKNQIGTGRDVRLDFLGVPIFYTPWISFPVGDQRKSGLLFPTIGSSSKNGTQLALPYYFNVAPNYDATLTTRWYSSRGVRLDPELRYLGDDTRSQLNVEYLVHDEDRGEPRSFVDWRHVTRFAPRSRLLIDAANVSDKDYFEDFGVGFEGTSVTFVNRYIDFAQELGAWSFDARAQGYQVIDRELPDEDAPYRILPQLTAIGRWNDLVGDLGATVYAEATNFARDVGTQGVRLDAEPALDWRVDRGGAFVEAGAGYRYTQYFLTDVAPGATDSPSRSLPAASLDAGLVLERAAGARGNRVQTLEPRVLYLYVPYRNQDDLPVFDTGIPDLNLVQLFRDNRYVGSDRVGDADQISVGVTTRLLDATQGRQFLSATLGQAFYFEEPRVRLPDEPARTRSSSDMIAEVDLSAFKNWNARFAYQWNPDLTQGERTEAFVQYNPSPGQVLNFGYRFRRDLLEQIDTSGAWPLTRHWRGFARLVYSLKEDKTHDQFVGFEYTSCCWAVRFITRRFVSSRTGDSETSFGIQLELKGLSNVGVDNEAFLRDAIRGYSALPSAPRT